MQRDRLIKLDELSKLDARALLCGVATAAELSIEGLTLERLCELARAWGGTLEGGELLLLSGEMGAGKTTFTRALGAGMNLKAPQEVCSPTYTVCMTHDGPVPLVHLDLFRLGEMGDGAKVGGGAFESLGLAYDALPPPGSVLVVEWSQLWLDPPPDRLVIDLHRKPGQNETRDLCVRALGPHHARLLEAWRAS